MTSRQPILDAIEYIYNNIANCSHFQEIASSFGTNDKVTQEDATYASRYIREHTQLRRFVMQKLLSDSGQESSLYRCSIKHQITARGVALELLQSDFDNEVYKKVVEIESEHLYIILSKFLGYELVTCGRCFNDMIEKKEPTV